MRGLLDRRQPPDRPAPSPGKAPSCGHRSIRAHRAGPERPGTSSGQEIQARLPGPAARALLDLSPDQREVVLLRVVVVLSVAEVAEILGKSLGGVKGSTAPRLRSPGEITEGEGVS